jgi:methyltransferase (TIGR00027 family)
MHEKEPSRTALETAAYRAAHQTVDGGAIFADPLALTILGPDAEAVMARCNAADPSKRRMRIFMAARSRFAEDRLALAVARGVRQAVILGAGLDTFGLRNPSAGPSTGNVLRVIEVDHPATQAWKRERLAHVGIAVPASLTFVPVDLTRQDLLPGLVAVGFQPTQPAFFHGLGVVPYLPRPTVMATLRFIGGIPGSEVVFDYAEPIERYREGRRAYLADMAARAAALGEPWVTYFDPAVIAAELRALGFEEQEDIGVAEIAARYLGRSTPQADRGPGPHVIGARRLDR